MTTHETTTNKPSKGQGKPLPFLWHGLFRFKTLGLVSFFALVALMGIVVIGAVRRNSLAQELQSELDRISNDAAISATVLLNTSAAIQNNLRLLTHLQSFIDGQWREILPVINFHQTEVRSIERLVHTNPVLRHVRIYVEAEHVLELFPVLYSLRTAGQTTWLATPETHMGSWYLNYADLSVNRLAHINEANQIAHVSALRITGHRVVLEVAARLADFAPTLLTGTSDTQLQVWVDPLGQYHHAQHPNWQQEHWFIDPVYLSAPTATHRQGYLAVAVTELSHQLGHVVILRDIRQHQYSTYTMQAVFGLSMALFAYVSLKLSLQADMKKEVLVKGSQLSALSSQIDAHFLYNTLETIKMLAEINDNADVSDAITSLGKIFRYNLNWRSNQATLGEELAHVQEYLALANLRFEEEIPLTIDIADHLLETPLPRMSLQPVVENSLKHGYCPKLSIHISAHNHVGMTHVNIRDTGKGIDNQTLASLQDRLSAKSQGAEGLGLKNIDQRLKLNHGPAYGLTLTAEAGAFTQVSICVPTHRHKGEVHA